ncbi:hypothetical protein DET48_13819 [Vibrio diazotrophicus]|uniref:Uncharacterized protein n=1 Tax=Vibrio diazotrophicus TaxID=685 RepID=A0A329E0C1_VIBDI|nr:hypothetical protein [Vibrio diazotrophicus]RAS57084.1 hypothetical protein DET48_13819 [Vibrio diazotrophicus]
MKGIVAFMLLLLGSLVISTLVVMTALYLFISNTALKLRWNNKPKDSKLREGAVIEGEYEVKHK